MTAHDHREYVEGCYRCDLSRDERFDQAKVAAWKEEVHRSLNDWIPRHLQKRQYDHNWLKFDELARQVRDVNRRIAATTNPTPATEEDKP